MESLFPGAPVDLTQPGVLWHGDFRPVSEIPPPVRHAAGYAAFATHLIETHRVAVGMAADVRLLVEHLRRHRGALRTADENLLDSAGIFLGNSLVARVEDGRWQRMPSGELEVTQGSGGAVVLRMVRAIIDADDERMPEFDRFLRDWDGSAATSRAQAAADRAASHRLELRHTAVTPSRVFVPPQGASLVGLLQALIGYLTAEYRATATRTGALPGDPRTISPTVETIRVQPASRDGAPLILAIDVVGAISMRAGALGEFSFYGPNAAELESTLLAIAAGLYRETCSPAPDGIAGYRLGSITGHGGSSRRGPVDIAADRRTAIAEQLDSLPRGWAPWPIRHHPDR